MSTKGLTAVLFVLILAGTGCAIRREKAEAIARDVSRDVAKVPQFSEGEKGAPIMILEEQHTSRAAQIQEAIVLNRLFKDHKVTTVGLEGYIKEQAQLTSDWFFKAAGNSQAGKAVAVALLREGEISSAEFGKLIYKDTIVSPIETRSEFEMQEPEARDVFAVCLDIIFKVTLRSLRPEAQAKLQSMLGEVDQSESNPQTAKKREAAQRYIFNTLATKPETLSTDPWVTNTINTLKGDVRVGTMPLEKEVEFYRGIQTHAQAASITLEADERRVLDNFVTFLQKRMAATKTMVESVRPIADQSDVYAVAMIVGAAHTDEVCRRLKEEGRPFAVVRPNSLDAKDDPSVIPMRGFLRKYQGNSIYGGGITDTLLQVFPANSGHHPPTVLQQQWFEAKSELYLYTERISRELLGGGGNGSLPPAGSGSAPYGFGENDFRGNFIYIDAKKIKIVTDGVNGKGRAVVFPIEMNPNDPVRHKTIWTKAARVGEEVPAASEKEDVEKMLKEALHDVEEKSRKAPSDEELLSPKANERAQAAPLKIEDEAGRIKITRETMATYGFSEDQVTRTVLAGQ